MEHAGSDWPILRDPALAAILAVLPQARLVGGAVRDALAGLPVTDIDLATPEKPAVSQHALEQAGIRVAPTGLAHGTITAIIDQTPVEITTLRRDVATDGRHASVAWTLDWRDDAARRDFTINAMSLDRSGALHDHFGGAADLREGRVRFVGDAATRIAEDYLRILRFFRFQARYGRGEADEEAVAAIRASVPGLAILSVERVWNEMKRILQAPDPCPSIALMHMLGVLGAVLPEGADPIRLAALVARGAPADPLLRMAALLTGDADALADRLRLSLAERERLLTWQAGPVPQSADPAALRRLLADADAATLSGRVWLSATPAATRNAILARLAAIPRPVFPLAGRDALALGATPGPAVGAALRIVRERWIAGGCVAGREELVAALAALVADGQARTERS